MFGVRPPLIFKIVFELLKRLILGFVLGVFYLLYSYMFTSYVC